VQQSLSNSVVALCQPLDIYLLSINSILLTHCVVVMARIVQKSWRCFQLAQYTHIPNQEVTMCTVLFLAAPLLLSLIICVGCTIGVLRFDSRRGLGIFLFTTASRTAPRPTQPPIQWVPGVLSLRVKRPGREAYHSPPSSGEVKNAWSYTSTPPIRLHSVVLTSTQGQLVPSRSSSAEFNQLSMFPVSFILLGTAFPNKDVKKK
jgi:hypothetical protein